MTDPRRLPRLDAFALPKGIYLDGNSLGPLSYGAQAAIERRMRQWQVHGVAAWDDWFGLAERLSGALGRLVGAHPDEVIATGSITVNLHALLATFYRPQGARRAIVATALDFPSDLYALRSWADVHGAPLILVPSRDGHTLAREDLEAALTDGRASFVVLGDRHSTLPVGETNRIWYPGAPEPTETGVNSPATTGLRRLASGVVDAEAPPRAPLITCASPPNSSTASPARRATGLSSPARRTQSPSRITCP